MLNVGAGLWFGVGARSRRPLQLTGRSPLDARLVSYEDHSRTTTVRVEGWRLDEGPGLSVDAVLLIATSLPDPATLHGHLIGWMDVEGSLAQRWPAVSRVVTRLEPSARLMRLARRGNGGGPDDRSGPPMRQSEWSKLRGLIKHAAEAIGMELEAGVPQVRAIAIPGAGLGIEASLATGIGRLLSQSRPSGEARAAVAS